MHHCVKQTKQQTSENPDLQQAQQEEHRQEGTWRETGRRGYLPGPSSVTGASALALPGLSPSSEQGDCAEESGVYPT